MKLSAREINSYELQFGGHFEFIDSECRERLALKEDGTFDMSDVMNRVGEIEDACEEIKLLVEHYNNKLRGYE